jgi:hypothetical protein
MKQFFLIIFIFISSGCAIIGYGDENAKKVKHFMSMPTLSYLKENNTHIIVHGEYQERVLLPFGSNSSLYNELKSSAFKDNKRNILITKTWEKYLSPSDNGGFGGSYLFGKAKGISFTANTKETLLKIIKSPDRYSNIEVSSAIMWIKEKSIRDASVISKNNLLEKEHSIKSQKIFLDTIDFFEKSKENSLYLKKANEVQIDIAVHALKIYRKYSSEDDINQIIDLFQNHGSSTMRVIAASILAKHNRIAIIKSELYREDNRNIKKTLKKFL